MKKIICVIITITLIISICGCNKKSDSTTKDDFLNHVFEIDAGQYSAEKDLNHANLISNDPILTVDTTVQASKSIVLNGANLSLTYKNTVHFPVGDKTVYRYLVDGDESKIIEIDTNGNINRIRYEYTKLDISKNATPEEVLIKLKPELEAIRDLSKYEFVRLPEQQESDNGFGSYQYSFYNMEGSYVTDSLSFIVFEDGSVHGLRTYDLPDEKRNFTVNEEKLNEIIEAKLRNIYDTDTTKYVSFKRSGDYSLTVYDGKYYLVCAVSARHIRVGAEVAGFLIPLLIPMDLITD